MASYTKLPSGWRARVRKSGASISKVFPTKALAQAWATKEENDIYGMIAGVIPDKTLKDLFDAYKKKQPNEASNIDRISKYLEPETRLRSLSVETIRKWQESRLQSVSEASVYRERKTLSAAFNYGIKKLKWLKENPLHGVDSMKDGQPKSSTWGDNQVELLCHSAGYEEGKMCVTDTSRVAACLLFSLETAMRSSEICRAKREDIRGRVLHVPITKNGSARDIPLSQKALSILSQLPEIDDTLFALSDASRDALFRKVRRRAGIDGVDFHSARRTALTRLSQKFDVLTLAKISGHRDISILLKHYYSPKMEELATRLDE